MAIIAVVRLAPGQVGFFDELTRTHLTMSNPQKNIFAGMNTEGIKRSVKSGRLILVSGSLDPETNVQDELPNTDIIVETKKAKKVEPKIEEDSVNGEVQDNKEKELIKEEEEEVKETIKEEIKEPEKKVEETVVEEVKEEKKPTKKSTAKKKSSKNEPVKEEIENGEENDK